MTIKTVKSSGGDYTTLQAAINACPSDITAAGTNETWEIECYSSVTGTENITVSGKTTDSSHYIRIYTPAGERHNGVSGGFSIGSSYYSPAISCSVSDLRIEGIRFVLLTNGTGCIYVTGAATRRVEVSNCIALEQMAYGLVKIDSCTGGEIRIRNCITKDNMIAYNQSGSGYTTRCYNNTGYFTSNSDGFTQNSVGTMICKNNIVRRAAGSGYAYNGTFTSSNNNQSSDTSAPGSNPVHSADPTFVNAGGNDFHLASNDTVCNGLGADLSGDADWPFSDDIDYQTRSGAWSIGADQIAALSNVPLGVIKPNFIGFTPGFGR